jgi:hypothetical protein
MTAAKEQRREGPENVEVFVRPAEGRLVPRLDGKPWTAIAGVIHGDWIAEDQYVRRRLADADLVFGDPAAAEKAAKEAARLAAEAAAAADSAAAADVPATPRKVK